MLANKHLREGAIVSLTPNNFGIVEILDAPKRAELRVRRDHRFHIGLVGGYQHTVFFVLHWGHGSGTGWGELPFALGVLDPDDRDAVPPPRSKSQGYFIHYELVDLATHVVMAVRAFSVTPPFSALLQQEVEKLRTNLPDFTFERHCAEIADYCGKHPLEQRPPDALIIEQAGMRFPASH